MAISRVGLVTLAAATTTGWACVLPACAAGDVAFTFIMKGSSADPTTVPAGYTLLDPADSTTSVWQWCYAKVLTAGDSGATHTWAWSSIRAGASCLVLRGVETTQVLDVADPPAATPANSTTVFPPASASVSPGAWALWASASAATATHAFPATNNGNTVTREVGSVAGGNGLAWATYPTAGTVASLQITLSVTGRCLGKTLVVRPFIVSTANIRVTQTTTEALVQPTAQRVRVSQVVAETLTQPSNTQRALVTQMVVEALYAADLPPAPTGLQPKRWDGSAWQAATVKRWDGSAWVTAVVKRWNGTGWV